MRGRNSRGAALLLCLLLLFALTLLGLAAASDAGLQSRMTGNLEKASASVRIADANLAWAESWLLSIDGAQRPATCSDSCATDEVIREAGGYPDSPERQDLAWWSDNGFRIGYDPVSGEVMASSLAALGGFWIMEEVQFQNSPNPGGEQPGTGYYRGIALGKGPDGKSIAVTESIFARPWGNPDWTDPLPGVEGQAGVCRRFEIQALCGRLAWRQRR
jgi:Tfp pilus assembly protein PilX